MSQLQGFTVNPIGTVRSGRSEPVDDGSDAIEGSVLLDEERFGADALAGLNSFSHVEVVYLFHRVTDKQIELV